jgi:uncharacterized protein (DUF488 family)
MAKQPILYSCGYERLRPEELVAIMDKLQIDLLVDVRSVPNSRRPGFGGKQLAALLGPRYHWNGNTLGGRGTGPTEAGYYWLSVMPPAYRLLLLCKEEAPGDCHRHRAIAVELLRRGGPDVLHVYQNHIIEASELQRCIEERDAGREWDIRPYSRLI